MIILGINAYHGDVAAVLLRDGDLVAAVEEERFRRVKHWAGFPRDSIRVCMELAGISAKEIDCFAISRDPNAHLVRKALFALKNRPSLALIRDRARNRGRVHDVAGEIARTLDLDDDWVRKRTHWVEHHPSHLASAFFVSPFDEASVCALDGFGDFVSTSMAIGRGSSLHLVQRTFFPHSLGLLYLALTQYLGFHNYGDEYKVMGLAPYGQPEFSPELRRLVHLKRGGRFELDLSYFRHWSDGVSMDWESGEPTIGRVFTAQLETLLGPARLPEEPIEPRHQAIASSLQQVFEDAAMHVLNDLYRRTHMDRLCLAGGCAMNSVMNGKIRERTPFQRVYIQPAAGDNGTALGAAFYVWHHVLGKPRGFTMTHAYWGPESHGDLPEDVLAQYASVLERAGCSVRRIDEDELYGLAARRIAEGKVLGWFQGRMEWGARALGNRSILADPRRSDMRDILNQKIKLRELFRPFAPSIVEDALDQYFVGAAPDPFMLNVHPIAADKRHIIPAVTHVDGTGRLQTVSQASNPRYWRLLKAFQKETGVPVLLNTSFNENEPIVQKSSEALDCFLRTDMDVLVLGDFVLEKSAVATPPPIPSCSNAAKRDDPALTISS